MTNPRKNHDLLVGVLGIILSLICLFVWIPTDIDSGILDVWRRNVRIGDAMLPTFTTIGLLLASITITIRGWLNRASRPASPESIIGAMPYVVAVTLIMAISLVLMYYAGPLLVWLWFEGEVTYRQMLGAAPWKYAGTMTGGTFLVFAYISLVSQQLRIRNLLIAVVSTAAIIALYDLPFDKLMLPPNGDY